tara:strand:+ start:3232 stop:3465 length:234 start_codon:yes stop_codon:yes gene_type:complete
MIDELAKDFLFKISTELKKDENKRSIKEEIIEPLFNEISVKIYPYISILFGMYCINLILIIIILLIILMKKNSKLNI